MREHHERAWIHVTFWSSWHWTHEEKHNTSDKSTQRLQNSILDLINQKMLRNVSQALTGRAVQSEVVEMVKKIGKKNHFHLMCKNAEKLFLKSFSKVANDQLFGLVCFWNIHFSSHVEGANCSKTLCGCVGPLLWWKQSIQAYRHKNGITQKLSLAISLKLAASNFAIVSLVWGRLRKFSGFVISQSLKRRIKLGCVEPLH